MIKLLSGLLERYVVIFCTYVIVISANHALLKAHKTTHRYSEGFFFHIKLL